MTILGTSKISVVSKVKTPSKDGNTTYYKLGCLVGSEAGMLSCSEDIYNEVEIGKTYDFETLYNDSYKSFRLNHVIHGAIK